MMKTVWQQFMDSLDRERQAPAVRESRNAVVAAGAGSGKTRVLAMRYLYLVRERGIDPSRIMCLTFTRKAASEMRDRIRSMLGQAAADDPVFSRALDGFAESRVSTLDSFCSEVARNASARWGVAPDFEVDDRQAMDGTRELALNYLLKHRHRDVVAQFIAWNGFETALESMSAMAASKGGVFGAAESWQSPDGADAELASTMTALNAQLAETLRAGAELDPGTAAGAQAWAGFARQFEQALANFDPANPASMEAAAASWQTIIAQRKPAGQSEAARYYNDRATFIRNRAGILLAARSVLADGRRRELDAFVRDFLKEAAALRAASGVLGFSDVAWMARRALMDDLGLRSWYKGLYDSIMIDEFQDDNELQKDLLYLVGERRDRSGQAGVVPSPEELREGALFFVGDEKQSIYGFRGADVSVFRGLAAELSAAPGGLGRHQLSVNWRSEPELIEFFNQTFSRVLPSPEDQDARPYEARFEPLGAGPATAGAQAEVSYVEIPPPDEDGLDAAEAQAIAIAELVRSLVDSQAPIAAKDGGGKAARPCRWEDIAILFRAGTRQSVLERRFRLAGIPYSASAVSGLFSESVLADLYAALRLAALPDDRLAWASYLRGPFARLSDGAVVETLAADLNGDGSWAGAFARQPEKLEPEDARRWAEAERTWRVLRERADRRPLRDLVAYLWHERGLRWNVLASPGNEAYLEHFDYAWSLAADADRRGLRLSDLVAELEALMDSEEKLGDVAVPRESSRGVAIMSVHASKGLEFPVVILPEIHNAGRADRSEPIMAGRRFGLSARLPSRLPDADGLADNPQAELEKNLDNLDRADGLSEMDPRLAETARLFYVACTRAISRLYLFGTPSRYADGKGKSFRGLLLRAYPWAGQPSRASRDALAEPPAGAPLSVRRLEPLPGSARWAYRQAKTSVRGPSYLKGATAFSPVARRLRWPVTTAAELDAQLQQLQLQPQPQPQPQPQTGGLLEAERDSGAREGFSEKDFGTLCHELLQSRLTSPEREARPSAQSEKRLARVSATARDRLITDALAMAERFLQSPLGLEARAAFMDAKAGGPSFIHVEYPFTYRADASGKRAYLNGSMDLVYGGPGGCIVVDFKTDRVELPERHEFQLAVYRSAACELFGVPARAFIAYLQSGRTVQVDTEPRLGALFTP